MSSVEVLQGALGRVMCSGPLVARSQRSTLWKTGFFVLSQSGHLLRYADPHLSPAQAVEAPCVGSLPVRGGSIAPGFDGAATFAITGLGLVASSSVTDGALLFIAPSEVDARRWIAALAAAGCSYGGEFKLPADAGAQAVCLDDGLTESEAVDAHLHARDAGADGGSMQLALTAPSATNSGLGSSLPSLTVALPRSNQAGLDDGHGALTPTSPFDMASPWAWPKAPGVAATRLAELRANATCGGLDYERQHNAIRAAAAAVKATVEVVTTQRVNTSQDDPQLLLTQGDDGAASTPRLALLPASPPGMAGSSADDGELARLRALLAETRAKAAADKAAAEKAAADAIAVADTVTAKLSVALDLLRSEQAAGEEMQAQMLEARAALAEADEAVEEEGGGRYSPALGKLADALANARNALTPSPLPSPRRLAMADMK